MQSKCTECGSARIASITADAPDGCHVEIGGQSYQRDEIPDDLGIGGGNIIEFEYCLNCGVIAADFPLDATYLETDEDESAE